MTLLTAFNEQCERAPEHIALTQDDRQLSYYKIHQLAAKISHFLLSQPLPCQRVAIALERGIDATLAILGIVGAGACYIPLDIKNPISRLQFIIADADVQFVIGQGECPAWLEQQEQWVDIDQLLNTPVTPIKIESSRQQLAAILYTSGSTGTPKGVALSHEAIQNFADWAGQTFAISAQDRIASLAPFSFDLSIFDIFTSLSFGASVYFVPAQLTLMPSRLSHWLEEQQISCWYTVPSMLSFLAYKGSLHEYSLSHLSTILFAGEMFPSEQLISLVEQLPTVNLYNLFGPTETNVCCYWPVNKKRLHKDQTIPIGSSACGAQLKIDQVTGELLVQSKNNLLGYWQAGQLQRAMDADGWFATGDKVSLNSQGEYCYHGRLDRMLKIAGYRIEPAEIETIIRAQAGIEQCAVIALNTSTSSRGLAAAVVLKANAELGKIRVIINQALPSYMQPRQFLILDSLPYLANGKTDYQRLEQLMSK